MKTIDRCVGMTMDLLIVNGENIEYRKVKLDQFEDISIDMALDEHLNSHVDDILNCVPFKCPNGITINIGAVNVTSTEEETNE